MSSFHSTSKFLEVDDPADQRVHNPVHVESALGVTTIDNLRVLGLKPEDAAFYTSYSPEARKKLLRKIDIRLLPMFFLIYVFSMLDRGNIGNAKIEGLATDLGLTGSQWNIALSTFSIPYVLLEVPSNMLLKDFSRPSIYLATLVTLWGTVMTLTGIVKNFAGLVATRFLLGVFEAGFYPAAVYLYSLWYMPKELSIRISVLYCSSALSGAFSGLLAAGIAQMDGVGGQEGWRWIFLLEGIATVVLGMMCFFCLIDSPKHSGRWLDPQEIRYIEMQHFIKEGGHVEYGKKNALWKDVQAILLNWRVYMLGYICLCVSACGYGNAYTLPTITKSMGFGSTAAQLMTAPPFVAGAISCLCLSKLSDRFYWRMPFIVFPFCLAIIGYAVIISLHGKLNEHLGPAYFAVILIYIGLYPLSPVAMAWGLNNIAPASRRAIGGAFMLAIGNSGGIVGSYMYLEKENPKYTTGFGLALAFGVSGLLVALLLELSYTLANKKKAKLSEAEVQELYSDDELVAMGDASPLFKYTL